VKLTVVLGIGQSVKIVVVKPDRVIVAEHIFLSPELDQALFHGSSIGGARPKALIEDQGKKYIAKFSSSTDLYNVVKAEFIAMRLATLAGLKWLLSNSKKLQTKMSY